MQKDEEVLNWVESPLRGTKLINVVFDPSNRLIATCSDKECLIFNVKTGERQFCFDHDNRLVGCFFKSINELVTVCEKGEMRRWSILDDGQSSLIATSTLTKMPLYVREENDVIVAVVKAKKYHLYLVRENGEMDELCCLPNEFTPNSFSISNKLVAVCDGKKLRVIATEKEAKVEESEYVSHVTIAALKEYNVSNKFESVCVRGDTVAASLTIGRIFIWSNVCNEGVNRRTQSVHWHKSAPCLLLTTYGGLFSAGGECVLCKWKLGKGAPSMIPRLASPISIMNSSKDDSIISLLLDDNSIVIIDASGMAVQTRVPTISLPTRSNKSIILEWDPIEDDMVVLNGREGSLQWLHPPSSTSPFIMDIGLENGVSRDLPIYGIVQSFHSVKQSIFSKEYVLTVEEESIGGDRSRIRVWERGTKSTTCTLVYSQEIGRRITNVASSISCVNKAVFILSDNNGRSVFLKKSCVGWNIDPSKDFSWKGSIIQCSSRINEEGLWAVAYGLSTNTNAIVIVDIDSMMIEDIVMVEGSVNNVEWTQSSLIASTSQNVYCFCGSSRILKWKVCEGWRTRVNPMIIAWKDTCLVVLNEDDGSTRVILNSHSFIENAIAFSHDESYGILLLHPNTKLSMITSSEVRSHRKRLPSIRLSSRDITYESVNPSPLTSLKSLNGPAHMLPPLSFIAPSFIQSCLLPSLV